jgi:hypothetical protein
MGEMISFLLREYKKAGFGAHCWFCSSVSGGVLRNIQKE